jgi:hypothetical protein
LSLENSFVSAEKKYYFYSGLRVSSEILIPEWASFESPEDHPDAEIFIRVSGELTPGEAPANFESVAGVGHYRLFVPGVGLFEVRNGNEIQVSPLAGSEDNNIRLYLLGTAWGVVCYQRGLFVLHGSAISTGSAAVAFCAPSGLGKSTLAAWLAARGFPLVSDDLCRVDIASGTPPTLYPSVHRLKLWNASLEALGWKKDQFQRDHTRMDKYHVPWQGEKQIDPLALRSIYLLAWGEPEIRRLSGSAALQRFLSAGTYRGRLIEPMGYWPDYCVRSIELLQQVPVWEFSRPRDLGAIDTSAERLVQHWREAGLIRENPNEAR